MLQASITHKQPEGGSGVTCSCVLLIGQNQRKRVREKLKPEFLSLTTGFVMVNKSGF